MSEGKMIVDGTKKKKKEGAMTAVDVSKKAILECGCAYLSVGSWQHVPGTSWVVQK
jgi:hypothetical protein